MNSQWQSGVRTASQAIFWSVRQALQVVAAVQPPGREEVCAHHAALLRHECAPTRVVRARFVHGVLGAEVCQITELVTAADYSVMVAC